MVRPDRAADGAPQSPDGKGSDAAWARWLASPPGRYLLQWEAAQLARTVDDIFGYYAVQLGMPALDALAASRMPHRIRVMQGSEPVAPDAAWQPDLRVAHHGELPFASQSVDLVCCRTSWNPAAVRTSCCVRWTVCCGRRVIWW